MLIPSRTKYRRVHRLPYEGRSRGNRELHFGDYGLQAKEGAWITANQIEAARIAMTRYMKRGGKVWINIFPHMPLTKKPIGTRQGKGKGNVEGWVAVVKEGKIKNSEQAIKSIAGGAFSNLIIWVFLKNKENNYIKGIFLLLQILEE